MEVHICNSPTVGRPSTLILADHVTSTLSDKASQDGDNEDLSSLPSSQQRVAPPRPVQNISTGPPKSPSTSSRRVSTGKQFHGVISLRSQDLSDETAQPAHSEVTTNLAISSFFRGKRPYCMPFYVSWTALFSLLFVYTYGVLLYALHSPSFCNSQSGRN
jgi:hypothetical protein